MSTRKWTAADVPDLSGRTAVVWSLRAGQEEQARRVLGIVMDGLRHGAGR